MHTLPTQTISAGFRTVSLRSSLVAMGHVLNIDHFHMSQPTFPPHPHAGFSAVTWMLPWSPGAFSNRDSLGDRSRIGPGSLHWTLAGRGMLHEELPELPGIDCEGLQIFVKLPAPDELTQPRAFHVEAAAIPCVTLADSEVRVLVGQFEDARAEIPVHADTTMLHVSVRGRLSLTVPDGLECFALVLRGRGRIGSASVEVHSADALAAGPVALEGDELELLVGWSTKMPRSPVFRGPFCMFEPERLAAAQRRFQTGEMGALAPSPVRWARP
jgi:hypothetical protein